MDASGGAKMGGTDRRAARRLALESALLGVLDRLGPRSRGPGRGIRVLVVDDSLPCRALAASILTEAGYEVRAVADGSQAWTLLQDVRFDVVVSDLQMPRMDGLDLLHRVRASAPLADLPVILNSSTSDGRARSAALAAGANDYIPKHGSSARALLLDSVARWSPQGGR